MIEFVQLQKEEGNAGDCAQLMDWSEPLEGHRWWSYPDSPGENDYWQYDLRAGLSLVQVSAYSFWVKIFPQFLHLTTNITHWLILPLDGRHIGSASMDTASFWTN